MNNYSGKDYYKKVLRAGGMTLVELLISVILVSVVILAGTAVWIAAQQAFTRVAAPYGTTMVQADLDLAMNHMIRSIRRANTVTGDESSTTPGQIESAWLEGLIEAGWDHDEDSSTPDITNFRYQLNVPDPDDPNRYYDIRFIPDTSPSQEDQNNEFFPDTDIVRIDALKFEGVKNNRYFVNVKITITPQVMGPGKTWVTDYTDYVSGVTLEPEIEIRRGD